MATRCTAALRLLVAITLIFYCYGRDLRHGVLTVKFMNGTHTSLKYQVPKALQQTAPGPEGVSPGVNATCCMEVQGDVAAYDSMRYSLYSSPNCKPSSRVCDLPVKVQAVWVCGCPGGDCSGEHIVSAQTTMLKASDSAAHTTSSAVSTEQLYNDQGLPTRITAFLHKATNSTEQGKATSDNTTASCEIQGFKVEYSKKSDVIGTPTKNSVLLGTGLKRDPLVEVVFQKQGSCLTFIQSKTRSGRSVSVGTFQPSADLHTVSVPDGADGLAALEGSVHHVGAAAPTGKTPKGTITSLNLLWGVSQCSAHGSGRRKAAAAAAAMDGAAGHMLGTPQELAAAATSDPNAAGSKAAAAGGGSNSTGSSGGDDAGPSAMIIPVGKLASQLVAAASKKLKGDGVPAVVQPRKWKVAASAAAQVMAGRLGWVKNVFNRAVGLDGSDADDVAQQQQQQQQEGEEEEEPAQVSIASMPQAAGAENTLKTPKWMPAILQLSRPIGFSANPTALKAQMARSAQKATRTINTTTEAQPAEEPQAEEESQDDEPEAQQRTGPIRMVRRRARAAVAAVAKPFKQGGGLKPAMFMPTGGKPDVQPASPKSPAAAKPGGAAAPPPPPPPPLQSDAGVVSRQRLAAAVTARPGDAQAASQKAANTSSALVAAKTVPPQEGQKPAPVPAAAPATATAAAPAPAAAPVLAPAVKVEAPSAHSRLAATTTTSSNNSSLATTTAQKPGSSHSEPVTSSRPNTYSSVSEQHSTTNHPAVNSSNSSSSSSGGSSPSRLPELTTASATNSTTSSAQTNSKDNPPALGDISKGKNDAQQGAAQTSSSKSSRSRASSTITKASLASLQTPSSDPKPSPAQTVQTRIRRLSLRRRRRTTQNQQHTTTTTSGSSSTAAVAGPRASAASTAAIPPSPAPKAQRFSPCRLSDPFCFKDEECYCRLANGTFGASCPMYGTCLGACCSTTGVCPDRMGYQDPHTGVQSVLLPRTCGDWGLDVEGSPVLPAGWGSVLECKLPKSGQCVVGKGGSACMGYTSCKGGDCGALAGENKLVGAMCVHSMDNSSRFDVCSCLPIY